MKITGWHVDGFGCLSNQQVTGIGPGITLLLGPNEAGKSTLMAFITTMLFGAAPRTGDRYLPLLGGQHGGRLFLSNGDGESITVERVLGSKALKVTIGNGELTESQWNQSIGHCDRRLFTAVYGFGLTELNKLDGLEDAALSEMIMSAGIVGAGRSASAALNEIDALADKLYKPRGKTAKANRLMTEMEEIDRKIRNAQSESGDYSALMMATDQCAVDRAAVESELATTIRRSQQIASLMQCWPDWVIRSDAVAELDGIIFDDGVYASRSDIERLDGITGQFQEWQSRLIESRNELTVTRDQFSRNLADHGPGWNRQRLAAVDLSQEQEQLIQNHRRQLQESSRALADAERAVTQQRDEMENQQRILEQSEGRRKQDEAPWSSDEIGRAALCIARMRATSTDLIRFGTDVDAALTQMQQIGREQKSYELAHITGRSLWPIPFIVLAIVLTVASALAMREAQSGIALVLVGSGLLSLLAAIQLYRRHRARRQMGSAHQRQYESASMEAQRILEDRIALADRTTATLAADARSMGLPAQPVSYELEEAALVLDEQRALRLEWDRGDAELAQQRQNLLESEGRSSSAARKRDALQQQAAESEGSWERFRDSDMGVTGIDPDGALSLLGQLRVLRHSLESVERIEAAIDADEDRIRQWQQEVARVASRVGQKSDGDELEQIQGLVRMLHADQVNRRRAEACSTRVAEVDQRLTQHLGAVELSGELRSELATGALEDWKLEQEVVEARLVNLQQRREGLLEESARNEERMLKIASSHDLAQFELDRATMQSDLNTALREWAELQVARKLIQQTLQAYERDRQPAVLNSASTRFGTVTNGRYSRVFRQMDEQAKLFVEDRNGARKGTEALSQGTLEQLYLCIRLGFVAARNERSGELPMLMDDVLVNFDPERARAIATVLAEVATNQQILIFTCHPESAAMIRDCAPDATIREMAMAGAGGVDA